MKPQTQSVVPQLSGSPFATPEVVDDGGLSAEDSSFLKKREQIIEAGRATFLEVGRALIEIRNYKGGTLCKRYGGWENYCKERWEFGISYAYRLVGAAEVVAQISPRGESAGGLVPTSEKQIRALRLLARPEDIRRAWTEANQEAGEHGVTSGLVAKAVRKLIKAGAPPRTAERAPKTRPKRMPMEMKNIKAIRVELATIRTAAAGTKVAGKIDAAIKKIEAWLSE